MRYLVLLVTLTIYFSSFAVNKRFIKSIKSVDFSYDKDVAQRGQTFDFDLIIRLNSGEIHRLSESKEVNFNDFIFTLDGNAELDESFLDSRRNRKIVVDKDLTINKIEITATLRKDETLQYKFTVPIVDYRDEIVLLELEQDSRQAKAGSHVFLKISAVTKGDERISVRENGLLRLDDFAFEIDGEANPLFQNGVFQVPYDSIDRSTYELTIRLKKNHRISKVCNIYVTYDDRYSFNFNGSRGTTAERAKNGRDGENGIGYVRCDPRISQTPCATIINGENGLDGENGEHGANGNNGTMGIHVDVTLGMVYRKDQKDSLIKVEVQRFNGVAEIRYIAPLHGEIVLNCSGGDGSRGGKGGDGGDGGSGGRGKFASTDEERSPESAELTGFGAEDDRFDTYVDPNANVQGSGGNGGDGGSAGNGGNGGDGGDGGNVFVYYSEAVRPYLNQIKIKANGGKAGAGGQPGRQGRAGKGGVGGLKNGVSGRLGEAGEQGSTGWSGNDGIISFVQL